MFKIYPVSGDDTLAIKIRTVSIPAEAVAMTVWPVVSVPVDKIIPFSVSVTKSFHEQKQKASGYKPEA